MSETYKHIVSVSGGKDSTALLLLATRERGLNVEAVFADTGHEHPETYRYIEYLDAKVCPIRTVKNDFTDKIMRKRMFIARDQRTKRGKDGRKLRWTNKAKRRALAVLHPTGNQFLDLCLWKGRFPSTRRRFCSEQLKHEPIREQIVVPLLMDGHTVISWQGVRADESRSRANLPIVDEPELGLVTYRPIIAWTAQDVFDFHRKHGIKWNPLYEQGMGRVGCMPCIHARKGELKEIAARWPEVIDWLGEMERLVSDGGKRGSSTFYDVRNIEKGDTRRVNYKTHGIRKLVEWANTTRGGVQFDLLAPSEDLEMCSSIYGLCESAE